MKKVLEAIKIKRESRKTQLLSQNIKIMKKKCKKINMFNFSQVFSPFWGRGDGEFSGISEDPKKGNRIL